MEHQGHEDRRQEFIYKEDRRGIVQVVKASFPCDPYLKEVEHEGHEDEEIYPTPGGPASA